MSLENQTLKMYTYSLSLHLRCSYFIVCRLYLNKKVKHKQSTFEGNNQWRITRMSGGLGIAATYEVTGRTEEIN